MHTLFQTKADRMANDLLCGSLKTAFPKMAVIGEESGEVSLSQIKVDNVIKDLGDQNVIDHFASKLPDHVAKADFEDFTIWVDPLDGTKEYTEGYLDHVTVLVGIAVGKKAIGNECLTSLLHHSFSLSVILGGIIHQPFWNYQSQEPDKKLGRTFYGVVGAGIGGHLNPQEPPSGERIVTSTRSHSTGLVGQVIDACQPSKVLKVGGAGHKVQLLMEGQAHCYVFCSPGCKKWDTCAPEAILHAIGKVTPSGG